jgi:hypothetical protein
VVSLQQGRVALQFATPNMLSAEQQARYRPGAWRIRAIMQAVFAGLLLAGAVSASAYSLGRSAVIVLVHALLALFGVHLVVRGLLATALGRRAAWLRVPVPGGRSITLWYGAPPGEDAPAEPFQPPPDVVPEPEDPLEKAGEQFVLDTAPPRLLGVFRLAVGVLLVVYGVSRGSTDYAGLLEGVLGAAGVVVWAAAVFLLLRALVGADEATGAGRAAVLSLLGAGLAWLFGIAVGPVDALQQVLSWVT